MYLFRLAEDVFQALFGEDRIGAFVEPEGAEIQIDAAFLPNGVQRLPAVRSGSVPFLRVDVVFDEG
jgi:hypothetical protein